jgi:hypothetical protein
MKLFIILLMAFNIAHAGELFGYVSQTAVRGSGVNIGGSKDSSWSLAKNEVNLSGDYRKFDTDFRFTIGTTDEPGLEDNRLVVKYALADRQWDLGYNASLGVRVGRVPHTLGFFNNTRNAPQAGQFIYLPEGIYREQFKWLAMSGDGGQVYYNKIYNKDLQIDFTGTWTKANLSANREVVSGHFNTPTVGEFNYNKSEVRGLTIEGRYQCTKFYYNWINLYFWLKPDFPFSTFVQEGRADTNVHVVGAKQYINQFEVGAEYLVVKLHDKVWQDIRANTSKYGDPTGWVISGVWHYNDKLDLAAYHSEYYTAIGDKSGQNQSTFSMMPADWFYVRADSVAAKYKIDNKWTLRTQYTRGRGAEPFLKTLNPAVSQKWNYLAMQAIYSF